MDDSLRGAFNTGSGMLALWEPEHFRDITDYLSWESELCEDIDIVRHIQLGTFVPLNVQADGTFQCEIRVGMAESRCVLSDRERRFLVVSSEPYLFRSRNRLAISGLEHIGREPGKAASYLALSNEDWAVTVHLIDWAKEPGALTDADEPTPSALPDFVVLLNPAVSGTTYRVAVYTFEPTGHS